MAYPDEDISGKRHEIRNLRPSHIAGPKYLCNKFMERTILLK